MTTTARTSIHREIMLVSRGARIAEANRMNALSLSLGTVLFVSSLSIACGGQTISDAPGVDAGGDAKGTEAGADAARGCLPGVDHREHADRCESHADAGPLDAGPAGCGGTIIPHDGCLVDGDCGATGVCVCQAPHGNGCGVPSVAGNACVPSNCRLDSDCAPCGKCRIEQSCGAITGFYCETSLDECTTNADCGPSMGICAFRAGRWSCLRDVGCAG